MVLARMQHFDSSLNDTNGMIFKECGYFTNGATPSSVYNTVNHTTVHKGNLMNPLSKVANFKKSDFFW